MRTAKANLYRLTMEQMGSAAFWINQDAAIMEANTAACLKLGYSRKELLGMTIHDIDPNFPKEAASRLQSCVREMDTVARMGGDEFTILLEQMERIATP